ncbi:MAG: phosphate regulon sensor histidine kinase PhoR [Proteobacteria bacterium]|nr:phosphate regulon sensor histidine kinase PhoR [Pseudomonadota bacterium]MDA1331488.1 phosphate regulon sensor histidine kinase PhoR [Pseudomonadota bacterium]
MRHWITALLTLIFPAIVAGFVALVWDTTFGLITLCIWLFIALWSERQIISSFESWINSPEPGSPPAVTSRWDRVFKGLIKIQKRQQASEAALSHALDRFEQAARALPDAVILLNKASQIEWCNTRAEEYFQLKLNRDRGVQIDYLLRQPAFRTFMSGPDVETTLNLRLPRTGIDRLISIQMIPFGHEQGLLLAQDITEQEQIETTRRDFVANISHELRTPLTVIQGFLETFEDDPADNPELLARGIELMSDQSRRMNRLITDLLALSRLETSNAAQEEVVDVSKLAHEVAAEGRTLSNKKHIIDIQAASDLKILGAEDEIRSALSNLVSNAVRYSPAGGTISIRWGLVRDEPVFSCQDQGVGIAADHIARLTERFYRVDKGRSRETGGTGLGLAIVKHVLNRHEARLKITSQPGQGSEFSIHFSSKKIVPQQEPAV